jgi:phosphoribosylanthranilate isomerase
MLMELPAFRKSRNRAPRPRVHWTCAALHAKSAREMNPLVKICGLSTPETLEAALAAGADMVGFVFFAKSPRNVTLTKAATLAKQVRGRSEVVALTVDMGDAELASVVDAVQPDWLQLHGGEGLERVKAVRAAHGRQVMKAVPVGSTVDLAIAERYAKVADRLLLDAMPPKGATRPGGLGVSFDWSIVAGFDPDVPWLISGGLRPGNVAEALRVTGAAGVDVSSGVETAPGVKSPELIRAFIANARAHAREAALP